MIGRVGGDVDFVAVITILVAATAAVLGRESSDGTEFEDRDEYRKYEFETNYTFKNKKDETLIKAPGQIQGQPFDLADLENCQVFLVDHSDQVQIDNLVNCRVYIGPSSESVFVRNCTNCFFTIACKQLRTRDCSQIQVSLYTLTDPIIETSTNVVFSTFNAAHHGLRQQFEAAHLEPENNHWTQVYDFNDPNKTGENWKLSHDAVEPWIIPLDQIVPSPDSLGPLENPVPATATPIVAHDTSMQSFSIDTSQEAASAAVDAAAPAVESPPSPPHEDDFVPAPDTTDASFYDENPAAVPVHDTPEPVHDTPEPVHEVAAPPPAPAALVTQQSWPVLNEFEAKMAAEVEAKREEEERLIREVKSKAEEELDKYYGDRTDKLAHRAATNRYVYCLEDEKKKSQELLVEMASEKPWNRVTDLVDTNVAPKPKVEGAANTGKKDAAADDLFDTSRMRSLLLQLKNSGGPEATAQ
ncbi:hypothetical protein DYB37_005242 [Aphanomyces astaci]|uniref:Clathrin light chain n=3 Tax=Aphanomyces astaci TaxID=112090 RepID=A0A3R6XMU0_APHAT|nr:hypothetical protein DYB35_007823 [Aphanomyces astaci]RHZ17325.1 hypothetical protein DYB37_005242 [Aphanomyces astaci]